MAVRALAAIADLDDLAKIAALEERHPLGDDLRALGRFPPGLQVAERTEVEDDRPLVAARMGRRNDVAANEAGEFSDDLVVVGLPRGKFLIRARPDLGGGDDKRGRAHRI